MKRAVFEVSVALAAAVLAYAVIRSFNWIEGAMRWGAVGLIFLLSMGAAWSASRGWSSNTARETVIGRGIRSRKGSASVSDVEVADGERDVTIGENIAARGDVTVKGINVGKNRSEDEDEVD